MLTAHAQRLLVRYLAQQATIICCLASGACAQFTPLLNAVILPDTLHFVTGTSGNQTSVVFHPLFHKYYSIRSGNTTFPLETWPLTGGPSTYQTTAGFDTRGMWFNPNLWQVERNGFSASGWRTVDLDVNGNALNTFATIFTGMLQPNTQSIGVFDPVGNEVLYYDAGVIHRYDRATGIASGTLALTGTSLAYVQSLNMIWTGQSGYEIGILDYVTKRILLFSRTTGAFAAAVQLPASAPTPSTFRFSYANNRV